MADEQPTHVIISRKEAIAIGLKRYFTGKPCKRGHITWRGVANLGCSECVKAAMNQFRADNLEILRRREREHYHANPEWARNKNKKAYERHSERDKKRAKVWYANNKQKAKETRRIWLLKEGEVEAAKARKRATRYRKCFPDRIQVFRHRNRAMRRAAGGFFTAADVMAILKAQRHRCAYCKKSIKKNYVMDHIVSLARSGSNDRKNMQATCPLCNARKSAKDPLDFARSLGMLL